MIRLLSCALVLVLGACDLPTLVYMNTPTFIDRHPLVPVPDEYADWYSEVEDCVGQTGDFRAVRWYRADEILMDRARFGGVLEPPHTITVINATWEPNVKHEMAHHITGVGDELHGNAMLERCT